jgi:hypothetical protein
MSALAIPELERMMLGGCQVPGCKHEHKKQDKLYFRQRCHPGAGLEVFYQSGSGSVTVACRGCGLTVAVIAVALV